ncbi:MAG: hypothetical protein AB7G21_05940 [Dehalococcoidia bacterium]
MTVMRSKRTWMWAAVLLASLLVACGPGQFCESDEDAIRRQQEQERTLEQIRQQQAALAASAATSTPTAAPAKAGGAGASATAAAGTPKAAGTSTSTATPAAASPYGGKIGLGFDHPPFAAGNGNLGGASAGIVCGALTGVAAGSTVTVNLSGGTGAPATVTGPVTGDGAFMIPFPINSYGPMNASIGGIKTAAGAALTGTVPPASLAVGGGPDVACTPK